MAETILVVSSYSSYADSAEYKVYMWPDLPKPSTYAHHGKERFSSSLDGSINKLTIYQYTTAKCWWVCFCWGLFLRPVRCPRVFGCPLNVTGRFVQAATLLKITTQLAINITHWFGYFRWHLEHKWTSMWTIYKCDFMKSYYPATTAGLHQPTLFNHLWY